VVSHRLGLTLLQKAVPDTTSEVGAMPDLLRELVLRGRILTLDAAHTQTKTTRTIVEKGAIMS
jgi:predicted transposase YbfD/YdcC